MKCPSFQQLIDFLDGRLPEKEAQLVENHLNQGCARCFEDRAWYEALQSITRTDEVFRPAPTVRKRALDLFKQSGRTGTTSVAARLDYDSGQRSSFAGARPADASGRQLVYRAAGYSVDVQIGAATTSGADIVGQILRDGETGFKSVAGLLIDLTRDRRDIWSTTTNGFGEFMMHEVDSGEYDLRIETADAVITIEGLPVLR